MTPTNLVSPRTSFVGRTVDLEALSRAWDNGDRLVTLVGTAGTGKTRLAIEYASRLARAGWGGGIWFCDLTAARAAEEICAAVGALLGVHLSAVDASAQLGRAIAARGDVLLVLDNFEQAVRASPATIGAWLDAAPRARFLLTSRERLHLPGERVRLVEPLRLPREGELDAERIATADAVRLLCDRTRTARSGTDVPASELPLLASLARRLEGIPLALELCAARLGVLGAAQLGSMLSRPLDVLSSGARGAPTRQATLRGAIEWSWDLLDADEARALERWSMFRGGFDLDAASAVLGSAAAGAATALDLLQSLHDKSLLLVSEAPMFVGEHRFSHYEAVRELAAERLAARGEEASAGAAHAAHFLALGERLAAASDGPGGSAARRRLALESDNLLSVHERALAGALAPDAAAGLRALLCLEPVFLTRGPARRYADLIAETLAAGSSPGPGAAQLEARALAARAWAVIQQGRVEEAAPDLERAVSLGDDTVRARATTLLALCAVVRGDGEAAARLFEAARAHLDAAGQRAPPATLAMHFRSVGLGLARQGRAEEACHEFEQALNVSLRAGDRHGEGIARTLLASRFFELGRLDEARAMCAPALEALREMDDRRQIASCLGHLAAIEQEQGRFAEAEAGLAEALAAVRALGDRHVEGGMLGRLAGLALERGDDEGAVRAYRSAVDLMREIGDQRFQGWFLAGLAAAEARLSRIEAARRSWDASAALLARSGAPSDKRAAQLLSLEILIAEARGQPRAALEDVRARLDELSRDDGKHVADEVRFATRLVGASLRALTRGATRAASPLVVGRDARWFQPPGGERVDMNRRGAVRRILMGLARARAGSPGRAMPTSAIVELGWPGERIDAAAAKNRAKVAVATLRRLGIQRVLVTRDDGYLLDPEVPFRLED